jgi:hypothetical protein
LRGRCGQRAELIADLLGDRDQDFSIARNYVLRLLDRRLVRAAQLRVVGAEACRS